MVRNSAFALTLIQVNLCDKFLTYSSDFYTDLDFVTAILQNEVEIFFVVFIKILFISVKQSGKSHSVAVMLFIKSIKHLLSIVFNIFFVKESLTLLA